MRNVVPALIGAMLLSMGSACQLVRMGNRPRWLADYEKAERNAGDSGKEMLIWYKEARPGIPDPLRDTFRDDGLRRRLREYVTCSLLRCYEPDRRYVAQYGVERAPAIIVVHADGTYHARVGRQSVEQIHALLDDAVPPGLAPELDSQIPRRPRYEWRDDFDAARSEAEQTSRSLLVVFYRPLSRDRKRLTKLLERPEVFRRLGDMVHCRLSMHWRSTRAVAERFGVSKIPALVIAHREGSYRRIELPTSYQAVVRFADEQLESVTSESKNVKGPQVVPADEHYGRNQAGKALAAPSPLPPETRR